MVLDSAAPQLADLELLLSVDRLGSLGKAARAHSMSQPAASIRIRGMERRLGLCLLERSPSGSRFTPAGIMIAKWAQTTVDAATRLLACSESLNNVGPGSLRISACLTMAECFIPRWLTVMRKQFPDIKFCMQTYEQDSVLADVRSGKTDLGFVGGHDLTADLSYHSVGSEELVIVVAPDHPWAHRADPLSRAELSRSHLVLREAGFGSRETVEEALGCPWQEGTLLELPSTFAIREAVEVGAGPGLLSTTAVARDVREGRLVHVPVAGLRIRRRLHAAWDRTTGLGPAARALLDLAVREQRGVAGGLDRSRREPQQRSHGELYPLPTSRHQAEMSEASAS